MPTWTFAQASTGLLTGRAYTGPAEGLALNTPAGCVAVPGRHDHLCRRLDTATGHVVPYQPPAPAGDEYTTHAWDAAAERWVPSPTAAAIARDVRAERDRRLTACDWTQLPDVPATTRAAWVGYRQALRDVTDQPGFPAAVTWPVQPTT